MSAVVTVLLFIVVALVFLRCIFAIVEVAAFLVPVGMLAALVYAGYAAYQGTLPPVLLRYLVAIVVIPVVGFMGIYLSHKRMARKLRTSVPD